MFEAGDNHHRIESFITIHCPTLSLYIFVEQVRELPVLHSACWSFHSLKGSGQLVRDTHKYYWQFDFLKGKTSVDYIIYTCICACFLLSIVNSHNRVLTTFFPLLKTVCFFYRSPRPKAILPMYCVHPWRQSIQGSKSSNVLKHTCILCQI